MRDILWNLFKKTGNFKYYLFFKKLEKDTEDENRKSNRNSNRRY